MYKVGDEVLVKPNAYQINGGGVGFASPMKSFCGQIYTIAAVEPRGDKKVYKLEGVNSDDATMNYDGRWIWVDEWLEPAIDNFKEFESDEMMNLFEA